jgi:uncharacterized protein
MKPFRKNVALAVDGGGIRGIIVTRALAALEEELGKPSHDIFRLVAGTSTGSIIAAGVAAGLTAERMHQLYRDMGDTVFQKTWRKVLFPLTHYRYPSEPLVDALHNYIGDMKMGDIWSANPPTDVVITTFDLLSNRNCFIKPWKEEYENWRVLTAVLASSTVPTFFPVVEGRYVDGGVGSYANPCYLAAYEAQFCLNWDPAETTLISLATGRDPYKFDIEKTNRLWAWQWLEPILGAFSQSADSQQVHLVDTFFRQLDFRRFQVDLLEPVAMDDASKADRLTAYGDEMGRKILNDLIDSSQGVVASKARF